MLTVPLPIAKQRRLFCLFVCHGILTCYGVGTPTHPYFFWAICHPSKTFPPKESKQEPQDRFSLLPTARPCPLTSDTWPTTSCISWVQAGDVWALHMLHFYVCPKPICSCVHRGLEARLHILPSIFDFLWHELFSDFSFFMTCSL